jgi:secreted trypsin-like serine protease
MLMRGLALMAAATMFAGCAAETDAEEIAESESPIIGGTVDTGHPAVGHLKFAVDGNDGASCTAALVAPKLLLTAAHCVVGANGEKLTNYRISFATRPADGPWYKGTKTVAHPGYSPKVFGTHDVAVVLLETAPPITPMPVQKAALGNVVGKALTHVGTGTTLSGGVSFKMGAGDAKKKVTLLVNAQAGQTLRTGETWRRGGICNGDSGGPAIMPIGGVETVVAVHSYVDDASFCLNHGYSTRTDANMDFLARYL